MHTEYKTHSVSSFKEYQDIILGTSTDQLILYRGQALDKPLLPKIARYNLVNIEEREKQMVDEFKRRSLHLIEYHPRNMWDWLALAQYHGMATRLLDWSENPLNALWFSIYTKSESMRSGYSVVWGFNVPSPDIVNAADHIDPFEEGGTKVFKPNHIVKRISAQFGWFTIHKYNPDRKFIPFEENKDYSNRLFKIKVQASCFAECKKRLHNFGINSATMFPDIDGLAKHVEWLFLGQEE